MDIRLKQRLVGAVVLVALAVIFIPMVLQPPEEVQVPGTDLPEMPSAEFRDRLAEAVPEAPPQPAEPPRQVLAPAEAPEAAPAAPADATVAPPAVPGAAELSNAEDVVPVPAPVAPPGPGAWVVQVGVFSQEANAQALAGTLRDKGHTAFVERFAGKIGPNYRVRLGPLKDRATAQKLQERLKRENNLVGIVKTYP